MTASAVPSCRGLKARRSGPTRLAGPKVARHKPPYPHQQLCALNLNGHGHMYSLVGEGGPNEFARGRLCMRRRGRRGSNHSPSGTDQALPP